MGDDSPDRSFLASIEHHRGALRVHCYRMLGSNHDGDDVVQETMLRAWRARDTLKDPAMVRPWLYRIATNSCLDELKRRPRRLLASDANPPSSAHAGPPAPPIDEPVWLEPMPDHWIDEAGDAPDARYTLKESVALAFVAALQHLTPPQRATLLLRDVIGMSAEETAEALGINVGAANSALFRAREAIEAKVGPRDAASLAASQVDDDLLARYVRAFETFDIDGFVALLHHDVVTTMPPSPTWIAGHAANAAFYRFMFPGASSTMRIVPTRANGQAALAYYRCASPGAPRTLHAIQVLTAKAGKVARIDHFMTKESFAAFALPKTIA